MSWRRCLFWFAVFMGIALLIGGASDSLNWPWLKYPMYFFCIMAVACVAELLNRLRG